MPYSEKLAAFVLAAFTQIRQAIDEAQLHFMPISEAGSM